MVTALALQKAISANQYYLPTISIIISVRTVIGFNANNENPTVWILSNTQESLVGSQDVYRSFGGKRLHVSVSVDIGIENWTILL